MKVKKMLEKLVKLMDDDSRKHKQTIKSLRELLKALKEKQQKLELAIEKTADEEGKQRLQNELDVIAAQRLKGKERLLSLRSKVQNKPSL